MVYSLCMKTLTLLYFSLGSIYTCIKHQPIPTPGTLHKYVLKHLEEKFWSLKNSGSQDARYPLKHSEDIGGLWVTAGGVGRADRRRD